MTIALPCGQPASVLFESSISSFRSFRFLPAELWVDTMSLQPCSAASAAAGETGLHGLPFRWRCQVLDRIALYPLSVAVPSASRVGRGLPPRARWGPCTAMFFQGSGPGRGRLSRRALKKAEVAPRNVQLDMLAVRIQIGGTALPIVLRDGEAPQSTPA